MAVSLLFHFPAGSDWYSCKSARTVWITYLEESGDVAFNDLGDISLEMLHQRSCKLGSSLATSVAFYQC